MDQDQNFEQDEIESNKIQSAISQATDTFAADLNELIENHMEHNKSIFEENDSITYSVIVNVFSQTLGQIASLYTKEQQEELLKHIVREILSSHEYIEALKNPTHRSNKMGNA